MDSTVFTLILGALLPIVITVILGYIAGLRKDFSWEQTGILNKTVMLYALPLNIFSGMVVTPRETLLSQGPLALFLIVALFLSYILPYAVARYGFKRELGISALQALAIGSPAVPFIGVSVLAFLFGTTSASLITISSLAQNLLQLPLCLVLLSIACGSTGTRGTLGGHVINAVKQPVVWAPVLAVILVFAGIQIPQSLNRSLALLGQATGGLALFSAGIVLQARKITLTVPTIVTVFARNVVVPGLCWLLLRAMHFSPEQLRQIVLTMSIPTGSIAIILAMQFKTGEQEMASSMALSVIASILTMGGFIWLTV